MMNRNVNMTGNFNNVKSLKPGDTAFTSRKVENTYGNSRVVTTNTNSNFNSKNNPGMGKSRFDENDLNEAKESLKLFKMKMGSSTMNNAPVSKTIGSGSSYNMSSTPGSNSNSNYRKPFKPTFTNDDDNLNPISLESKKQVQVSRTQMNQMSQLTQNKQTKNTSSNLKIHSNKQNSSPIIPIQELEDDRPAFAQGANNEYLIYINNSFEVEPEDDGEREECDTCGRRFRLEALEKHSKVCKKVFVGKRKAFDTKKQRIIDSEHAMMLKNKEYEEKKKGKIGQNLNNNPNKAQKKSKWKKQSEELRAIAKINTNTATNFGGGGNIGSRTGTNYNKPSGYTHVPSVATEDYTHCTMCNRKYNEQAYSKHLPTCERRSKEAQFKGKPKQVTGTSTMGAMGSKPNLNVKFGRK